MKKLLIAVAALLCAASFAAETANASLKFGIDNFKYYGKSAYTFEDGANGKVGAMVGDSGWSLQLVIPKTLDLEKTYEVYALVRGTFDQASENGFGGIGVYDTAAKKVIGNTRISVKQMNNDEYQRIRVGTFKFNKSMYIYVGGVTPKNPANRVFVKAFEFITK